MIMDLPLKLKYFVPTSDLVCNAGPASYDKDWYAVWLDGLVTANPDVIFFFVVETTDIFEEEPDFVEGELYCTGEKDCRGTKHANDCPKWTE